MQRVAVEAVGHRGVGLRVGADPLHDLRRGEPVAGTRDAAAAQTERDRARKVRRRHARPRDRVVAAGEPGRVDAHAGSRDRVVDGGRAERPVGEAGEAVVELAGPACGSAARRAGIPVAVGHGRNRKRLRIRGGDEQGIVRAAIARCDHVGDAGRR